MVIVYDRKLLRVQSPEGTKRVEVALSDTLQSLHKKACKAFSLSHCRLFKDQQRKKEISAIGRQTIKSSKFSHGDLIYLVPEAPESSRLEVDRISIHDDGTVSRNGSSTKSSTNDILANIIVEDEVDQILSKQNGRIPGKRNPMLCHHKGNSRCIHCSDLDPWDESYLKENNIKHMSFHSFLQKLKSGVDKGKFAQLSSIQCSIKPGCSDHPPWPQGICSTCQPSAVTLTRQNFRHVDAVIFENRTIVENFLTYWRITGHQRAGFLYGRYLPHPDVPLGIRAEVAAIYEPPQEGSADNLKLLPDPHKAVVDEIAQQLGLTCVGWLFTDLVPLDASSGTVRHLRHSETWFLSSHEVITAAYLQRQHPNCCSLAKEGFYGSKFATVIVTGDADYQVHMEGYQVSHQCEALVAANCLLPTVDAPELAYVKESTAKQYVPDVFYKEKDEYGNEVTRLGRPLPVEYLLLDVPVSTPNEPTFTFNARKENAFPIENRMLEGHLQDFTALANCMRDAISDEAFLQRVTNLHVLLYMAVLDVVHLRDVLPELLVAVRNQDSVAAGAWRAGDAWGTVERIIESTHSSLDATMSSNGTPQVAAGTSSMDAPSGVSNSWTCSHCTFINTDLASSDVCDMCHLPR